MTPTRTPRIRKGGLRRSAIVALFACVACMPAGAYASIPTAPNLTDTYVDGAGWVTLTWNPSTDVGGQSITYDVYRLPQPISSTNIPATPLTSVTTTSAKVAADAAEIAQSYVWFYAVSARETTPTTPLRSTLSKTMQPNLHGYRLGANSVTCTRCHNVHGAYPEEYDYTYVQLCYRCHGATSAVSASGAKSSLNIQAEFGDYEGQAQPGSVHRSTKMESDRTECDACHSAHRSPYYYDNSGVYQSASSFRKMTRTQTGVDAYGDPTYAYFSANTDTAENTSFCLACHGSDATEIALVGDPDDYSGTGGDHNEGSYATAAHGPAVVKSNDYGRPDEGQYPQVQCLACHDKHASAADKLIAYRGDDAGGTYAGADLCFACHSASSTESKVAAEYSAPFSWNDRDVEAEFGRVSVGGSAHPAEPAATGRSATCASCHNVHSVAEGGTGAWNTTRVSRPSNTKDTPADMTAFCLDCHGSASLSAVTTTDTLVPYGVGFTQFTSLVAPYFPGWDKSGYADSGHYTATAANGKALCENCHDPHASAFGRLTAWTMPVGVAGLNAGTRANASIGMSREENLCYQCHGNGSTAVSGVTTRRAPGAKDVITKAASANSHNPAIWTGKHSDAEDGAAIGATPHAECTDCHDPHMATTNSTGSAVHAANPAADSSAPGAAVWGAWGVVPAYAARTLANPGGTANWDAPTATEFSRVRLSGAVTDMEAHLCFKCHSQNIDTTMIPGLTDTALEFNPSNFSVHNVTGQSVGMQNAFTVNGTAYTWSLPANADFLLGAWTTNSAMTCTDCHTNTLNSATEAQGPHGSSSEWLIDPSFPNWTDTTYLVSTTASGINSNVICAKCHIDLDNANEVHSKHLGTSRGYCQSCHTPVPHGWKRPRLLAYTDDPLPYRAKSGGLYRVQRVNIANIDGDWAQAYCNGCSQHGYNGTDTW